jgi:hypothetical protein
MRYEIRRPAAVSAIAVLAAIVAFCPTLMMCAPPEMSAAGHSCCAHSQHSPEHRQGPPPCDTTSQTCPYLLLQKSKSAPVPLAVPPLQITAMTVRMENSEPIAIAPQLIRDFEGLYLRNRVLLI